MERRQSAQSSRAASTRATPEQRSPVETPRFPCPSPMARSNCLSFGPGVPSTSSTPVGVTASGLAIPPISIDDRRLSGKSTATSSVSVQSAPSVSPMDLLQFRLEKKAETILRRVKKLQCQQTELHCAEQLKAVTTECKVKPRSIEKVKRSLKKS